MAESTDFELFVEECRKVGLADIKALEAAWEEYAGLMPNGAEGAEFRAKLMNLLKLGAEYARMADAVKEGRNDG